MMNDLKNYYKNNKVFSVALMVFAAIALIMLLSINFKGHDYPYHIQRIASIAEEIRFKGLGAFPIRILSTNEYGFGYGSPMFYGDIFLYPFSLLILLGVNAVYAYRIMLVVIYALSFPGMYFAAKQISKNTQTALFAAFLYTFSAYFAIDIFIRSAIGEAFAFALCPYAAYGFYCSIINPDMPKKHRLFLVFGMTGMILSHLISTVVIAFFMAVFILIYYKNWIHNIKILADFLLIVIITLALSAFFVFPFLEQVITTKFYATAGTDWNSAYYGLPWESWIAPHGFWKMHPELSPSAANSAWFPGAYGFMLVTLLAIWLFNTKKLKGRLPVALFITAFAIIIIIMGKIIPLDYTHKLFDFMRLPWRTLLFCTLFMSIFGAYAVHKLNNKVVNWILYVMLVIPLIIISISSYQIILKEIPNMKSNYELTSDQIGTGFEYLPYNLTQSTPNGDFNGYIRTIGNNVMPDNPNIRISDYTNDGHGKLSLSFTQISSTNSSLELPLLYYKGYSAVDKENGVKYDVSESNRGLVNVNVTGYSSGKMTVWYTGTAIQHISDIVSLLTLICLVLYLFDIKIWEVTGKFIKERKKS